MKNILKATIYKATKEGSYFLGNEEDEYFEKLAYKIFKKIGKKLFYIAFIERKDLSGL